MLDPSTVRRERLDRMHDLRDQPVIAPMRCQSARDRNGKRITRGMSVLYLGCKSGEHFTITPFPVKVVNIHRQGADGTILTCDHAPKPDYPHHFSCRASDVQVCK